jgi:hypothetical protein
MSSSAPTINVVARVEYEVSILFYPDNWGQLRTTAGRVMAGHGRKNVDDLLLFAFAAGADIAGAARHAVVSVKTVQRRLKDQAFRSQVDARRAELVSNAIGRLSALGTLAGDVLGGLLKSQSEKVRLGAARTALDFMIKGRDYERLSREVAELRRQVEDERNTPSSRNPVVESDPGTPERDAGAGARSDSA